MVTEKRHPIRCKVCGAKMTSANEILRSSRSHAVYMKYICPKRRGESGCGARRNVRLSRQPRARFRKTEGGHFLRA